MIISFSVQNFGSIKERQTLSFEASKSKDLEDYYVIQAPNGMRLLKLALIYGANASGKTTILKALDFLRHLITKPLTQKNDLLNFEPFLFDSEMPKQPSWMALDFFAEGTRYYYEVEFTKTAVLHEELYFYQPNKAKVFHRTTDLDKQLTSIEFGNKIKVDKVAKEVLEGNTLVNNTVFGGYLKTSIDLRDVYIIQKYIGKHTQKGMFSHDATLSAFVKSQLLTGQIHTNQLVNLLQKADFGISDIQVIEKEREMYLSEEFKVLYRQLLNRREIPTFKKIEITITHTVANTTYELPIEAESQGTQKYFDIMGLLLTFLSIEPAIIPIDELESSLHPDLYMHFLLTFLANAKQSQLIATTHNREILQDRDTFRTDAIWFTEKNAASATELYSLADFDTKVIRDSTNIYNAYKSGKLGGVPRLGDYYIDLTDAQ